MAQTVQAWAEKYIRATDLNLKLNPPELPSAWETSPGPNRVEAPGRPPELRVQEARVRPPRKGALHKPEKRAQLLHTFFHHELQAAELMCWAILAFPETPRAFQKGLIGIAHDEIRHMKLYRKHIEDLGFRVGDFFVNDWFWSRIPNARSPAEFVATLNLGFEGGNLDHGARFETIFEECGDPEAAQIQAQVVREEMAHVSFGLRWYQEFRGTDFSFSDWEKDLVSPLSPMLMRGTALNQEYRRKAGFSEGFLADYEQWEPADIG